MPPKNIAKMTDDWKTHAFRQRIIAQLEELIRQTPAGNQKSSAHELEHQVFQRSSKREDYLQYIGRLMTHMRDMAQTNSNPQISNPHLAAVLAGQQGPGGQMGGPGGQMGGPGGQMVGPGGQITGPGGPMAGPGGQMSGPGGQMTGPGGQMTGPGGQMGGPGGQMGGPGGQMTGPGGQMGGPSGQMGGPGGQMTGPGGQMTGPGGQVSAGPSGTIITGGNMQTMQTGPRMPNQGSDVSNWPGNNHQRLNEMQMANINKKPQMGGQAGKINTIQMSIGPTGNIGQFQTQMVTMGRGGGQRQPRVPSPGFPQVVQGVPRQGTPTPSSASPAPPLSQQTNQASPAFVSPSPNSNMVPSPVGGGGGGMGRGAGHLGAQSPGGMINTPGQIIQQPSPANQNMTTSQAEEAAYREKVRQLSKFVDPLRRMIQRIGNEDAEKSKKMKQLHDMLQNPQRRMPMETLLKCELVLERLEIQRDAEVPPSIENRIASMTEAINTTLKSPCAAHTLHRTLAPALSVLLGPNLSSSPIKLTKRDNPLQPPPETPNINDVIQGEVARLNARFRVNLDCQQPPGSDNLTLICQLDDPNLPCVPPITLTVPAGYPEKPPRCDLLAVDYETTDFLKRVRESMLVRLRIMPPHCSLTMMLHSWEMSVRQACSPRQTIPPAVVSALALTAGF